jgi:hypothetical protein
MNRPVARTLAVIAAFAAPTLTTSAAFAGDSVETEFPITTAVYNTCADDLVLINATLVLRTELTQKSGRMVWSERARWENVTAQGAETSYNADSDTRSRLTVKLQTGQSTVTSSQSSTLRLTPVSESGGSFTVRAVQTFRSDLETGETQMVSDVYQSTC